MLLNSTKIFLKDKISKNINSFLKQDGENSCESIV